ncbi:hypothetical protein TYRP_005166 [Tyrophagus putrescentiae]|nr:hypothetical protein TYRP_005166 [Tyrophagus putrescentiae]
MKSFAKIKIFEVEEVLDSKNIMRKDFETLLETGNFSDVIFVVENKELCAHKAIICARSPVFAGMFRSECKESNENRVVIDDVPINFVKNYCKPIDSAE